MKLLQQSDIELHSVDIQVPDPWWQVGVTPGAPSFQNSYTGTATYMKSYDGRVDVHIVVANGTAATIFTLPKGFSPKYPVSLVAWDGFLGSATVIAQVLADGTVRQIGGTTHTVEFDTSFMAADVTPLIPPKQFPINIDTGLPSVAGMWVVRVEDGGTSGTSIQANEGYVGSIPFTTQMAHGKLTIKIKNIMGLPYNRKSTVTLLAIGGTK
jgi:hypothetical protein